MVGILSVLFLSALTPLSLSLLTRTLVHTIRNTQGLVSRIRADHQELHPNLHRHQGRVAARHRGALLRAQQFPSWRSEESAGASG